MSNTSSGWKPLRPLAPAPTLDGGRPSDPDAPRGIVPQRNLVKNACKICQSKKTKCDGKRPRCSRCTSRSLECVYDALYEGMTKQQSADYEISRLTDALANTNQMIHVLQHGTPEEARAMLALIRQDAPATGLSSRTTSYDSPSSNTISEASSTESVTTSVHSFAPLLFNRDEWRGQANSNHDQADLNYALVSRSTGDNLDGTHYAYGHENELVKQQSSNFGNLPFSSGIYANHYPPDIQQQQHANLYKPLWAIQPLTTLPGTSSVKESVASTIRHATSLIRAGIQAGQPADQVLNQVIGKRCNVAAIFDRDQYNRTSLLSKWAAGFVFSIQHKNRDFVSFASMHLVWTLARWMIDPSPATYEAIPEWLRPTQLQLWTEHVEMLDFVLWPTLRDTIAHNPHTLQRDWRWLAHMGQEIECDWYFPTDVAFEIDPVSGEMYLTEDAKVGHYYGP
ncbi:hypothetical protein BKA67DRAFT_564860 [Truncatella angustata]|uniref:Zn(2)-C6 fungal-type domain-containing protein n=1 Tax=Truncatella angustata TaxID=152316 RepID=A0A9P8ZYU2_9PEZI|nr:uncharacterized protein BKA67DRAFT_564860 [Truncatella angustata]KAH6654365.1 hypothetical protein BKA67DRAFT_564860 [Truncatella angustata]KAH8198489.1 hypothetical protein TruAng_007323 [Truncatella angustata]